MRHIVVFCAVLAAFPASAAPVEIYFAPAENLEHIDIAMLASAKRTIDLAAYSLADRAVAQALDAAIARGIGVRILVDASQRHAAEDLYGLADAIRVKRPGPIMHFKAYAIDGEVLRTGSANFSGSGLKQQDNDLLILRDGKTAAAFEVKFEEMWAVAVPYDADRFSDRAAEPSRRQARAAQPALAAVQQPTP